MLTTLAAAGPGDRHVPDAARRGDPGHWADLLAANAVTVWNSVPAQMQLLDEYLRTASGVDVPGCGSRCCPATGYPSPSPTPSGAALPG
ncbi:hypothetical protein [Streptomyces lavendulae]|uniref:hypothetical protein n=1 Tax=Streptomyces lavendulae TaxID=1914 RepID=UPI0036A32DA5